MHQERHAGHSPLFQVMLVLQNAPLPSFELPGLTLTSKALAVGSAKFDLTLSFGDGWGGLGGALEYDSDLFDRTTVERWAGYLRTLFAGAVADPGRPLSELSLLGATERP
jgi:non-ribosomal peptide synthetase component F